VPLEAALKGIDKAFESYLRSRRGAGKTLKSLAYCTDAVLEAAEEQQEALAGSGLKGRRTPAAETFSREELKGYFAKNGERLVQAAAINAATHPEMAARLTEIAKSLEGNVTLVDVPGKLDLQDLERRLTILDEKMHAALTSHAPEEMMLKIQREVDGQLAAYRRKMKADQLALIQKQYVQKRLLEEFRLPRLSLFYLA
jgi:hypothetical protein